MIKVWGNQDDKERLLKLLISSHRIEVSIQLMTLSHDYIGDFSHMLLGGQVTIDSTAEESTRALTLELLDPKFDLKLDASSPEDGSVYLNRMMRIVYSVISVDNQHRYDIPIFCGPLSKATRQGAVISVEGLGKEKLSMAGVWGSRTYRKGQLKTKVIQSILVDLAGESPRRVDTVNRQAKLPKNITLNYETISWTVAKNIAKSMRLQLFYDGRGVARLRKSPERAVYIFSEGGALLTLPQVQYDSSSAINAVRVIGAKPKRAKQKISYREVAPREHPLSPWSLGRNGTPRYLIETIEDDSIQSIAEAKRVAKQRLNQALIQSTEVSFDCLPIPILEEQDRCRVQAQNFSGNFVLTKMTIPLTAEGVSSVGYLKRVTPNRRLLKILNTTRRRKKR